MLPSTPASPQQTHKGSLAPQYLVTKPADAQIRRSCACTPAPKSRSRRGHIRFACLHKAAAMADLVNISSVAGRQAIGGAAVYAATKFAVTAFSEALRQELTHRHVRVSAVEPGAVTTELTDYIREHNQNWYASMETLQPEDIADAVAYIVTRPRHVAVNELLIRPTEQA
jgi:NAD(P)-dependent dehydrogenase (short-subunit alcohol dehydrogenase family)